MARNKKHYSLTTVDNYITNNNLWENTDIITGSLIDTYIIYHGFCIEVFEETYVNPWASDYVRHIYRKGLPQRFLTQLDEELQRELDSKQLEEVKPC